MFRRSRSNALVEAVRSAGPTRWRLVAGAVASVVIIFGIGLGLDVWNPIVAVLVVVMTFVIVGVLDRDAFVARCAIYQYGELQAARIGPAYPTDAADVDAWLADPAHASEVVARAFVQFNAGRLDESLATLDEATTPSLTDQASAERLRLTVSRSRGMAMDPARFDRLVELLPPNERRWQRLSLAVMELNGNVTDRLPWRDTFVQAVRDLGPWSLPKRAWFVIVTQQFTMSMAFGLVAVVLLGVALS